MMPRAMSNNMVEEVPPMSIQAFRAYGKAKSRQHNFDRHMRNDVFGSYAEADEEIPPDPYTPARLPQWGLDESDPFFMI